MKSMTRLALAAVAMLIVAVASAQLFEGGGIAAPEPVTAYDNTELRLLHRAVMPRAWVRSDGAGMVITWRRVDDTSVAPGSLNALPTSFRVERREDSGADYTTIADGVANTSSHPAGKIKVRDKSALPGIDYRYRVVVLYEGGENTGEFILRDSQAKSVPFLRYDYKFEGAPTADGITLSWRPAVWEAHEYRITRQSNNPGESPIAIGTVAHDPSAKRLTLTDTTATASGTYRYFFFPYKEDGTVGDLSISTDVTKP